MISDWVYPVLFVTALIAGFVDSIAGGGGLITIPMLLTCGLPPHLALGTNKLQATFGSFSAAFHYTKKGLVSPRRLLTGILATAFGASVGTITIQLLSPDALKNVLPFLLMIVLVYFLLSPKIGLNERKARLPEVLFYVLFGVLIGFYDGFLGPGTGSFWTMAFVFFLGLDLRRATAHTKVMNFISNIVSMVFFILSGKVLFTLGLLMGAGQTIGALLGSRLVIRRETGFVRQFFLMIVTVTILKLIVTTFFGL